MTYERHNKLTMQQWTKLSWTESNWGFPEWPGSIAQYYEWFWHISCNAFTANNHTQHITVMFLVDGYLLEVVITLWSVFVGDVCVFPQQSIWPLFDSIFIWHLQIQFLVSTQLSFGAVDASGRLTLMPLKVNDKLLHVTLSQLLNTCCTAPNQHCQPWWKVKLSHIPL